MEIRIFTELRSGKEGFFSSEIDHPLKGTMTQLPLASVKQ
jgi:hypothetical protein